MRMVILLIVFISSTAMADIYQCEQNDGKVSFQDKPCKEKVISIKKDEKESEKMVNIMGVSLKESELYDDDYMRRKIEESKEALIDDIRFTYEKGGEYVEHKVDPVEFYDFKVSKKRFLTMPVICGKYTSALSPKKLRYVYGLMSGVTVEEDGKEVSDLIDEYCPLPY